MNTNVREVTADFLGANFQERIKESMEISQTGKASYFAIITRLGINKMTFSLFYFPQVSAGMTVDCKKVL